ncbi:hypothetical protein EYC84_004930 [Monilinia fructicola]|uniref:Uncharacterized protein n=1 Tax=Monilinia fructicola TaxID=38448 RepID=A0A5M9K2S2_MONFR|nr:hypothetical protein EYC84_004930 [Monilinia fructicola]
MEGSSFQVHADYTNHDAKKNQTQTSSLKINVQTLRVSSGNNNATDDIAMSGLDCPMTGIANNLASQKKPQSHSSNNTGEIQQQADMARMLQPTIRALQSATDKAVNKCAKRKGISGAPTKPRADHKTRSQQKLPGNEKATLSNHLGNHAVTVPKSKSKKAKKKKNGVGNTQPNNSTESYVKKTRKRKPKKKEETLAERLTHRLKSDALMTSNAEKTAKETADQFKDIHDQAPNPKDWQTLYEQEYQARTAMLRARQLRDEQALLSALDGLSLGGSESTGNDYDLIL